MASVGTGWATIASSETRTLRFSRIVPYLLVAITVALYLLPIVRVLTWTPDEGTYLVGADRILHGELQGRDFIEISPPGAFYWIALFFKLFGTSIFTARALLLATGVATVLAVFHLSRRLGASGIFAAVFVSACSIPMMVMNSPHYDTNLFGLLGFATVLAIDLPLPMGGRRMRKAYALAFAAGLFAGGTACMIQQKGLIFAVIFALSIIVLHGKRGWTLAAMAGAGSVVPLIVQFSYYAACGALPDLIYSTFVLPLSTYKNINAVPYGFPLWEVWLPVFRDMIRSQNSAALVTAISGLLFVVWILVLLFPLTAVLAFVWRLRAFRREWIPYWLMAYGLWISELNRQDMGHLRNGCLVLMILFFALCELHPKAYPKYIAVALTAGILFTGGANLLKALGSKQVVQTRRGTMFADEPNAVLAFLLSHTKPQDFVFVYPYSPIYYFLADLRNPTRYAVLLYDRNTMAIFADAIRDLDLRKPKYVLWDTNFADENLKREFPSYQIPPSDNQVMEIYLKSHYHQIAFENKIRILERNP